MTRTVFIKSNDRGIYVVGMNCNTFSAWVSSAHRRKMDLTQEMISRRERNAHCFFTGWDDLLESKGIIFKIKDVRFPKGVAWMIDSEAAARVLNCSPRSICKNIEIMRYLTPMPRVMHSFVIESLYPLFFKKKLT